MMNQNAICTLSVDGVDLVSYRPDADRIAYVGTIPAEVLEGVADALGLPRPEGRRWVDYTFGTNSYHSNYKLGRAYVNECAFELTRGGASAEVLFQCIEDLAR